ncbi:hypothetical protein BDR26DRAFT_379300 [Obelidium mucronatum]|nr:hypothetical protein BDR26DRAFT_379300 [Obelidium mucronatum]
MMADGDALVRLMADLQRKISQIEMQVSLMKPIALQVTEILTRNPMGSQEGVGSSRSSVGNTPRAQSSAPVKRRETSTSGPAWTGNDGRSLCTATSNTKTPKQKTDNDAWMKSFAYNYTEMDDCPIVPDVTDRDRIFKEAESREKGSSLWTRMAKKVMSPGSDGGSAPKMCLSDSRKKLSAEAPKAAAKAATAERRKSFSSKFSAIARSFESERVASADDGCPPEVIESQTLSLDEGILRRASKDRSPSALLKDKRRLDKRKSNNPSKRNSIDCEQQSTPEPVDMPVEESIPPKATDSLPSPSPPTDGVIENYVGFMNTVSQKPLKFTPPPPRLYEVGLDDVVKLSRHKQHRIY